MQFRVERMACGGCARTIAEAIAGLDGTAKVAADPAARTLRVETAAPEAEVRRALAAAGYPAS